MPQEFEKYPRLADQMKRLGERGSIGNMQTWVNFKTALNEALEDARKESGWRDIESAPRNMETILLRCKSGMIMIGEITPQEYVFLSGSPYGSSIGEIKDYSSWAPIPKDEATE